MRLSDAELAEVIRQAMVECYRSVGQALLDAPEHVSARQVGEGLIKTSDELSNQLASKFLEHIAGLGAKR